MIRGVEDILVEFEGIKEGIEEIVEEGMVVAVHSSSKVHAASSRVLESVLGRVNLFVHLLHVFIFKGYQ